MPAQNTPENTDKLLLNYSAVRNEDGVVAFSGSTASQGHNPGSGQWMLWSHCSRAHRWCCRRQQKPHVKVPFPTAREKSHQAPVSSSRCIPSLKKQAATNFWKCFLTFCFAALSGHCFKNYLTVSLLLLQQHLHPLQWCTHSCHWQKDFPIPSGRQMSKSRSVATAQDVRFSSSGR